MVNNKIILDTNLWISFLISKKFAQIDESIEEFIEVANRPKFKKYFSKGDVDGLLDRFDLFGELNIVRSNIQI